MITIIMLTRLSVPFGQSARGLGAGLRPPMDARKVKYLGILKTKIRLSSGSRRRARRRRGGLEGSLEKRTRAVIGRRDALNELPGLGLGVGLLQVTSN